MILLIKETILSVILFNQVRTYQKKVIAFCDAHLDSLKKFEKSQIGDSLLIDLLMIRDQLNAMRWYVTDYRSIEWNPANWNIAGECAEILNGTYAPLDVRLKSINERLKNTAGYYELARKTINNPTVEHTELAILQHDGSVEEVFGNVMRDSVERSALNDSEKQELLNHLTKKIMKNC